MSSSDRKPVPVKRSRPGEEPVKIPSMAQKKRPSCLLIILILVLVAGIALGVLWYFDLIHFPIIKKEATPTLPLVVGETMPSVKISETATPSPSTTGTFTPEPSLTFTTTATHTRTFTPTQTPTPTEKPMPYIIKGKPEYQPDSLLFQGFGCDYLFIGGQVWDLQDNPMKGLTVQLRGTYGDEPIVQDSETGSVSAYGASGYGFNLSNKWISEGGLSLVLVDADGNLLSSPVILHTSTSCQENLILVNFKQVR